MTARTTPWGIRGFSLLAAVVAIAAILGHQLADSASSPAYSASIPGPPMRADRPAAVGQTGGALPDGTTVFATRMPGVAKLDSDLRATLQRASTDAGIDFVVDSGWRSRAYQERLLQEAIAKYGSRAEAARWVATPNTSAHVSGDAVDLGSAAATWLSAHGAAYGLCQIYANELWHFELRPGAAAHGCPPTYADPTHDPRMHQ